MNRKYNEELAMFDNSEVFHEFIKIAYDSGLSSYEEPDIGKEKDNEKAKLIESLYSDEATEDQDKDGDELIEDAHKDKVEVLNSYLEDAGEYKNSVKTHKITENVATKGPEVNNIWHKNVTAIKNLMDELIVIAEEMEVRKQDDIVSFADNILERIDYTGDMVKEADVVSKVPWKGILKTLGIIGTIGGGAYLASSHIDPGTVFSVNSSCRIFINRITKYLDSDEGKSLSPVISNALTEMKKRVAEFADKYKPLNDNFQNAILNKQFEEAETESKKINVLIDNLLNDLKGQDAEVEQIKSQITETDVSQDYSRETYDLVLENAKYLTKYVTKSDVDLIKTNLVSLIKSLEEDKKRREQQLSAAKKRPSTKDEDTIEV